MKIDFLAGSPTASECLGFVAEAASYEGIPSMDLWGMKTCNSLVLNPRLTGVVQVRAASLGGSKKGCKPVSNRAVEFS